MPERDGPATPTLYLLCGIAFSGKTTLGRAISQHAGLRVVSTDEILALRGFSGGDGVPFQEWEKTHAIAVGWLDRLMASGEDLVVDDTNCYRWIRDRFRWLAGRHDYATRVIYLETPLDVLHRRRRANERSGERHRVVDEVFESHAADFEPPADDEDALRFGPGDELEAWLVAHFGNRSDT